MINACYAVGFRGRLPVVIGDELVAAEYLKLWEEEPWGTLIRSTDSVVVDTVQLQFPELLPYLAPVTVPAVAEPDTCEHSTVPASRLPYAGTCPPINSSETRRGHHVRRLGPDLPDPGRQRPDPADLLRRVPEERPAPSERCGGAAAGPAGRARYSAAGSRRIRGLDAQRRWRAVAVDRLDLGSWISLSTEGSLGPPDVGPAGREASGGAELLASTESAPAASRWWTRR